MSKKRSRPTVRTKSSRKAHPQMARFLKLLLPAVGVALVLAASGFAFAATRESQDAFCASCHTMPESTFYQRSVAATAVDLASAHQGGKARCIDCHSGVGISGRMAAEMLGAHNALAFYSGTAVQPAPLTHPVGDEVCLKCHADATTQPASMNNHFHVFLSRWQAVDPNAATCVSCHKGHATDGSAEIAFLNQNSTEQVCQACHAVLRGE